MEILMVMLLTAPLMVAEADQLLVQDADAAANQLQVELIVSADKAEREQRERHLF
jgi:hypothetical protein